MSMKSNRYTLSLIAVVLATLGVVAYALAPQQAAIPAKGVNKNQDITLEIIQKLDRKHFLDLEVDDALSSRFLDNYLDRLDPNKAFFYQSDINSFESYRYKLDDQLKNGDNSTGFIIYTKFKQRLAERLQKVIKLLENDSIIFDFSKNESIDENTENQQWLASAKEGEDYWRKRIKSFLLSQKLSGESPEKARDQLIKRTG